MATSQAYDVTNERMGPSGGGNIAGRNAPRKTRLIRSPVDLDVEIAVQPSGSHGQNRAAGQSATKADFNYNRG